MYSMLRNVLIFLWVSAALGTAQATSHGSNTDSVPRTTQAPLVTSSAMISSSTGLLSTNSTGTCPSRTVNYVTHTLARQCLRTDRAGSNGTSTKPLSTSDTQTTFATTVFSDDRPQVITVTYTVANGATTIVAENSAPSQDEHSTASATALASATSFSDAVSVSTPSAEEEADSALDNAQFLSFEDWKKQNLAKSGQSPEDVGRTQTTTVQRPRPVNNALDTLGDEQEIDIDFAAFGGVSQASLPEKSAQATEAIDSSISGQPTSLRSKDAGKTCKERTNYASFDCAATVLKSNKEAKSATSVLVESKDSYMLNKCSADNKFFIVELCNDIQIDTVVLANYEFFSSGFRHFRLSVSDRYPVKMEKWRDLGTFEARNTREIQAFLIENPQIWARYLRIEFLTHYGTEYYCPVSLLRVHGITMMEDYRHQEELARGEVDDVTLEAEALATPPIHQEPAQSTDEVTRVTEQAIPPVKDVEPESVTPRPTSEELKNGTTSSTDEKLPSSTKVEHTPAAEVYSNASVPMQVGPYVPSNVNMTCDTPVTSDQVGSSEIKSSTISQASETSLPSTVPPSGYASIRSANETNEHTTSIETMANATEVLQSSINGSQHPSSSMDAANSSIPSIVDAALNDTTTYVSAAQTVSAADSSRPAGSSASSPPPAQPSTQESFFKSVHKRLQQLESNSTLSLQYIEEQSRILREAFGKVEKRQVATTSKFLTQLNDTVMVELHGFRQAYDQLWQSTVIELEGQRELYQREMLALSTRLTMVADELVWQKRMGIVQSTLLLMCLALVLFGRTNNGALEMPLMQQLLNKSTTALSGWDSPPNSPSPDSRSPVSLFRRKLWRSSTSPPDPSLHGDDGDVSRPVTQEGPEINVEAPSPPPPQRDIQDEWEEEGRVHGTTSMEASRKAAYSSAPPSSPGKKKKRNKKSLSDIRFAGLGGGTRQGERTKSPLANGTWD
ncbi:Putative SUN domain-containing protein [Septoria linicola]|uniref:SUN domain-containing protein n=1 Tax=Septoria linicola TaxID=215465 RepID=A0A9Q9ASP4_9PEZI|nr:putative SUN domain-containing protein [Septoria linicola]USW51261.1 Putative SUN domain-containing protein [Septoria linicola]